MEKDVEIFQTNTDGGGYRAVITSEKPIFVCYHDVLAMAEDLGLEAKDIDFCLRHGDCPKPVNHDKGMDGAPENGIWIYDRLLAFFDWYANRSFYATMRFGKAVAFATA